MIFLYSDDGDLAEVPSLILVYGLIFCRLIRQIGMLYGCRITPSWAAVEEKELLT